MLWIVDIVGGFADRRTRRALHDQADQQHEALAETDRRAIARVQYAIAGSRSTPEPEPGPEHPPAIAEILAQREDAMFTAAWELFSEEADKGLFRTGLDEPGRSDAEWIALRSAAFAVARRRLDDDDQADSIALLAIVKLAMYEERVGRTHAPRALVKLMANQLVDDCFRRLQRLRGRLSTTPEVLPTDELPEERRWSPTTMSAIAEISNLGSTLWQETLIGDLLNVPNDVLADWLGKSPERTNQYRFHGIRAVQAARLPDDDRRTIRDTAALITPIVERLAARALAFSAENPEPDDPNGSNMKQNPEGPADADEPELSTLRVVLEHGISRGEQVSDRWFAIAAAGELPADVRDLLERHDRDRMRQHDARRRAMTRRFQAELSGSSPVVQLIARTFRSVAFQLGAARRRPTDPPPHAERSLTPAYAHIGSARLAQPAGRCELSVTLRFGPSAKPGHFDVVLEELPAGCRDAGVQYIAAGEPLVCSFGEGDGDGAPDIDAGDGHPPIVRDLPVGAYVLFCRQGEAERVWPFTVEDH